MMSWLRYLTLLWFLVTWVHTAIAVSIGEQNEALLATLQQEHRLSKEQMQRLRLIFNQSGYIGQGNPAISVHPMTPDQCHARRDLVESQIEKPRFLRICGRPHMAPLYDPAHQAPEDALACIDQFEFPDIPCAYPVVWVRAVEAAKICQVIGKRLCDAHEWEGACEGRVLAPDYRFDLAQGFSPEEALRRMRSAHNQTYTATKSWSYGSAYERGICGTGSQKTATCPGGGWSACGSNTYPSGAFIACRSILDVYDLNGNAAEHMNLPLSPSQMTSLGSQTLGYTEMKGSWFVFDSIRAHEDWCRWRAPYWHGTRVLDSQSHANYHLSFRCCNTVSAP